MTCVEEVLYEAGRQDGNPLRKVTVLAAIKDPLCGKFDSDLSLLMQIGGELGSVLCSRLLDAFENNLANVESYGKAAIVGTKSDPEHGHAILTRPFANKVRSTLKGTTWMPSNSKRGPPGSVIDVPLASKTALYVRSHFHTIEARMPDAPLDDEIVIVLAATNRGRLNARLGGLRQQDVTGRDVYVDAKGATH